MLKPVLFHKHRRIASQVCPWRRTFPARRAALAKSVLGMNQNNQTTQVYGDFPETNLI